MLGWILLLVTLLAGCTAAVLIRYCSSMPPGQYLIRWIGSHCRFVSAAILPVSLLFVLFMRDLPFLWYGIIVALLLICLGAIYSLLGTRKGNPPPDLLSILPERWFPQCVAVAGLCLLGGISIVFYECLPFVGDCCVQLAHARIFERGLMTLPPPPAELRSFMQSAYVFCTDQAWRSQYFPGHILMIALCDLIGLSWMTNPVLGAGSLWLVYSIGRSLHDRNTGRIAALFLLFSPFFMILQSEMMSHGSTLFFCLAAVRLLCCPMETRSTRALEWLGGFCLGMALIARPLSAAPIALVIVATPPSLWSQDRRRGPRRWIAAALGGIIPIAFLFFDNYAASGNILTSGYRLTNKTLHQLGFDATFPMEKGLSNTIDNLTAWNDWLFGWPYSSFTTVAALFLLKRSRRSDHLMLLMTLLLSAVYFFYRYQDTWFGPRFLYEAQGFMAIVAAHGCAEIYRKLKEVFQDTPASRHVAAWCSLALVPFLVAGPIRAYELMKVRGYKNLITARRKMMLDPLEPFMKDPKSVVFVDYEHTDILFVYNTKFFPNGPLFPLDKKERNAAFYKAFPDRDFYRLSGGKVVPLSVK